jgi:hypothetical protein
MAHVAVKIEDVESVGGETEDIDVLKVEAERVGWFLID